MAGSIEIYAGSLEGKLHEYQPIEILRVKQTEEDTIWNDVIRKYHYLGYDKMIGQRIKYIATYKNKLIAAISYNRASLRVGVRDAYIGWNEHQKLEGLNKVVNSNRFLILPWVKIKNLASHILSRTLKLLRKDWYELYGVELFLAETFVEIEKYKGTCYLAANWKHIGETKGYGK